MKLRQRESVANEAKEEQKRAEYERLCEGEPDSLFVLGGRIIYKGLANRPRSAGYGDKDFKGFLSGAKARSIAAGELHDYFPNVPVVAPSNSIAMVEELERMGVNKEQIITDERSYTTFTELIELVRLVIEKGWHHTAVVTSEYHIPRAKAMLERIHELHDPDGYSQKPDVQAVLKRFEEIQKNVKIVFVSAEEVLPLRDPGYKAVVDAAKSSPAWADRVRVETTGLHQIERGEYWQNPPEPPTSNNS